MIINNNEAIKDFDSIKLVIFKDSTGVELSRQYLGKTTIVSNNDFIKYGFSFFNNNNLLLNNIHLGTDLKNIINNSTEYLELIEKIIAPTISEEDLSEEADYFGSTIIDNSIIFTYIDVPENVNYVYLYDRFTAFDENYGYNIRFEDSELASRKGLCIFLHKEESGKSLKVNLIQESWVDDLDLPMRNLNKFFLRNDEYNKLINNINAAKYLDGYSDFFIDSYSGSLLSNLKIKDSVILTNIKNNTEEFLDCNTWDRWSYYKVGDIVRFNNNSWTSLSNNNRGNMPELSSDWELTDNLINFYTKQFEVYLNLDNKANDSVGEIYPDKIMNIYPNTESLDFYIKLNPGYTIKETGLNIVKTDGSIENNVDLNNNNYGIEYNRTQDYSDLIKITDISKFNEIEELNFDINKKVYNLTLALQPNSSNIETFTEKDFNTNFRIDINNIQVSYRSSEDIVIRFDEVNYTIREDLEEEYLTDEEIESVEPFNLKGFKIDNVNSDIDFIRGEITTTKDTGEQKDVIKVDEDTSYIIDYSDKKIFIDKNNSKTLDNGDELVVSYEDSKNISSLLTNRGKDGKDGTSTILTNTFPVKIGDVVTFTQLSNSYSINKIVDNYGNLITPDKVTSVNGYSEITYTITPSIFDDQDLTIEYYLEIDEIIKTVYIESITSLAFDKYTKKSTERDGDYLVFKFYAVDEYKNVIDLSKGDRDTLVNNLIVSKSGFGDNTVTRLNKDSQFEFITENTDYMELKISLNVIQGDTKIIVENK